MMAWGMVACVLLQLLPLYCANELNCTVRQNGDLTSYSVDGASNLATCDHEWTNVTNHVLANKWGQMKGLVVNNSFNQLITSKCMNTTYLMAFCPTEGEVHTAVCNTICREHAPHKGLQVVSFNHWIVILALLLLGVLVGLVLCYKYKDKIPRLCCCDQSKGLYPADNMQKIPTNDPSEVQLV